MCVLPVCIYMYHVCAWFPYRLEEGFRFLGQIGVMNGSESSWGTGSSIKATGHLTTELCLSPDIQESFCGTLGI